MKTIPKAYDASKYEDVIYKKWERSGIFRARIDSRKKPFSIAMPPPNATGTLHLGHATMLAIEDVMIRYKRMAGFSALWLPGTDHASIATQNKVEKLLAQEGKSRHDLGRQAFLKQVRAFVKNSQDTIRNQIRKMGSSCDWSRERYTLDEGLSHAVSEIFVRMYKDGLIYRGDRIVNWCPRCSSTLADDEVSYRKEKGKFYYMKYGPVTIGTARPETKFLDKTIVVHPKDKRYKHLVGKKIMVPWINGDVEATVIADHAADMEMGSGAMTLTPAHSFIDFDLAQKYKLPIVQIIDEKGNLTEHAGEFAGMNAYQSREAIIQKLQSKGLIESIDEHYEHNLSVCYRCGTPVEPLISKQWFVDVQKPVIKRKNGKKISLKERAIEVVKKGEIKILPDKFNKTYYHWMENLRDWCISRQIWFGHRIPVYYCTECKDSKGAPHIIVSAQSPKHCPKCKGNLKQDPDTLDTWFSSGLWTFSTLGWPQKTPDLKYFHPTSVLETGYDILFFWVARMILMTSYALNDIPFRTVYLHGLIRTRTGEKMSKSHPETCIDPLDMIQEYGADAVRLSLLVGSTPGNDMRLYKEKIAGYRNFVNKIWNASRFALIGTSEKHASYCNSHTSAANRSSLIDVKTLNLADRWILSRTQKLISDTTADLDAYCFSEAGCRIYNFTWGEYCDWYLECSKVNPNPAVLRYVLEVILKLLHPFVPYVTEVLWGQLGKKSLLISEDWPKIVKKYAFDDEERAMNVIFDIITALRSVRAESHVEASKKIDAILYAHDHLDIVLQKKDVIQRMAGLKSLKISAQGPKIPHALFQFVDQVEIYLPLLGLVDVEQERKRLDNEIFQLKKYISVIESKLSNKKFVQNAPREIVENEKHKLDLQKKHLEKIEHQKKLLKHG